MTDHALSQNPVTRYNARMCELAQCDPQVGAMLPKADVKAALRRPGMSLADIIATVLEGYEERPALAERSYELSPENASGRSARRYLPAYSAITYGELRRRTEALANAWRRHPEHGVAAGDFICILGFTGIDFTAVELAAAYVQAVTVPLQTSLAGTQLEGILKDTAPATLVATLTDLEQAVRLAIANRGIRSVVAIEYDPRVDAEREIFEAAQGQIERAGSAVRLTTIGGLIEFGRAYRWEPLPPHVQGAERMALLIHSSGSTGTPKGVIIPERMAKHVWIQGGAGANEQEPAVVGMVFAPMNHFMGRYVVFGALSQGGTAHFTMKPDLSTLFEDIRLVRPTFMSFFPRILELVYQYYQGEVVRRTGEGARDAEEVDAEVRAEMRAGFLGNRLRGGTIGSAPIAPEVKQFMRDCFDIMLLEGYGSTEGGIVITFEGRILRDLIIDYKLRDVPELGYYGTDKPYPRGELCVKSRIQSPGYFKRPEATAALFDEDGYVKTGDIMEERAPDHLVYIDRRNDVLKLSQAEFVAVGQLGATFEGGSAVIRQIHIYGNSSRSYLLAVVVPDMEVAASLVGHDPSEPELRALIRSEMLEVARSHELRTFEVPRDFIIELEPFTLENGLLSSVRKRMRPNFQRKYGERLEALYVQIERKRHEELMALKDPGSPLTVLEKVVKALEASLGIDGIDPATTLNFADLGGDSLGTVSFSMFLKDIFGVAPPVNSIISPAGNPRRWAEWIETELGTDGSGRPSFACIHGKDAKDLQIQDLDIERFLDPQDLRRAPTDPPRADTRTVLLTGANGFLGRFLCLSWLERLAAVGGKLICLIRAADNRAARQRLDEVFTGLDPELTRRYQALAGGRLEVIAADVAEPRLGLQQEEWDRLAREVDHVVHPAALVNHMLAYEHLFGPNVAGTAELVRLALTTRQKRFDFVSSAAVTLLVDPARGNDEDSPLLPRVTLSDDYAAGYGVSKWASEALLQSAQRRYGLPVNVFRGDMMMPHTRYHGQINVPDMITRLLYSIVLTGLAPESFYEREPNGSRARTHYDGLPVDYIAEAMVGIGTVAHREIRTFNISNHHDDGVSLDTMVDWIESAGYPLERIRDHAEWVRRFEAKLSTLTDAQRQRSSLAIMGYLDKPHPAHQPSAGSEHFTAAVRDLPGWNGVPHLTEAYVHKYLDDMHRLGLIASSKEARVADVA